MGTAERTRTLFPFNDRAYESYGKTERQGENAPIGQRAAFAYTTALNHLLGKDSTQRVQVGDASTVFWTDRDCAFEGLFAELFGNHEDPARGAAAVKALYESLAAASCRWANATRASSCWAWHRTRRVLPSASGCTRRWPSSRRASRATSMTCASCAATTATRSRLQSSACSRHLAVQGKADNVPPRLAGEWMRSILEGRPYPAALLNAAVVRCKAEQDVTYLRAALLKAWLNRDHRRRHPICPRSH